MSDNDHLVHALRAAAQRWEREIAAFGARHALGGTDVRALVALLDLERAGTPSTPGALATQLHLSSAACTALVDRLAAAGLVERAPDPGDRRRVQVLVTAHARRLGEEFFADLIGPIRASAAALSPAEAEVVGRFLASAVTPGAETRGARESTRCTRGCPTWKTGSSPPARGARRLEVAHGRAVPHVRAGVPGSVSLGHRRQRPRAGARARRLRRRRARAEAAAPAPQGQPHHGAGRVVRRRRADRLPLPPALDDLRGRLHRRRRARAEPLRRARLRRQAVPAARGRGAGPAVERLRQRRRGPRGALRRALGRRPARHPDGGPAHPSGAGHRARQQSGPAQRAALVGRRHHAPARERRRTAGTADGRQGLRHAGAVGARAALPRAERLPRGGSRHARRAAHLGRAPAARRRSRGGGGGAARADRRPGLVQLGDLLGRRDAGAAVRRGRAAAPRAAHRRWRGHPDRGRPGERVRGLPRGAGRRRGRERLRRVTQVRQRVALIHGHRRAYRIGGSGPALLLIHGMADNSATFEPILERLAERYTVIVPDLLGHGLSGRPRADYSLPAFTNAMRDLLLYLGIERATLVGHSLGGGIAGQFTYQYPEMVERLVFVNTGGVTRSVSPVLKAVSLPMSEIAIRSLALPGVLPVASAALDLLGRVPLKLFVDNAECARVLAGLPHAGTPRAFARTLRAVVDPFGQVVTMLDRTYVAETVPVLVVWGSDDPIIPVEHAHLLHASLPSSRLEVFDGAGHFPFRSDPDRFLAVLTDFVDGTDPARLTVADLQDALRRDADLDAEAETPA